MRRVVFLPTLLAGALAACSASSDDGAAVSADEARQLNEAADMLDANSVDLNAVAPAASNESQPE